LTTGGPLKEFMDESSPGVPDPGPAVGAGAAIVVRQSRLQRDGLFGALVAVFLVALARGYPHAQTSTGRVVLVVFVTVVTAALVVAWARLIRRPCRLEITGQAVTFVDGRGAARVLSRDQGDQLRVVRLGSGRYRQPGLAIAGSGTAIPLPFFSVREVRRQCVAAGWSFAGRR
jgi:hypothetical protein